MKLICTRCKSNSTEVGLTDGTNCSFICESCDPKNGPILTFVPPQILENINVAYVKQDVANIEFKLQ